MAENSAIEWTDHTFNPWRGCTKVAEGCRHCYADTLARRNPGILGVWGPDGTRVVAAEDYWRQPLKWNAAAECLHTFDCANGDHSDACPQKHRPRVFCASLADVFEDWQGPMNRGPLGEVLTKPYLDSEGGPEHWQLSWPEHQQRDPQGWRLVTLQDVRNRLFALIDATSNLDWILLTKRPENVRRMWTLPANGRDAGDRLYAIRQNVWLLTSIATQADADRNLPELLKCRDLAAVLGLSCEPLVGPVNLGLERIWCRHHLRFEQTPCFDEAAPCFRFQSLLNHMLDWIIVGGESGPAARPLHPMWAMGLQGQCYDAGVPFFFKQWGEWSHEIVRGVTPVLSELAHNQCLAAGNATHHVRYTRVGKKAAGRLLCGWEWSEFPRPNVIERRLG